MSGTTSTHLQDHNMSDDYQHKERKRRSLERKVSAHSSGGFKGGEERRDKCRTKDHVRQKSQKWWIYIINTKDSYKDTRDITTYTTDTHNTVTYGVCTQINYIMNDVLDKWESIWSSDLTSKFVLAFFSTSRVLDTAKNKKKQTHFYVVITKLQEHTDDASIF